MSSSTVRARLSGIGRPRQGQVVWWVVGGVVAVAAFTAAAVAAGSQSGDDGAAVSEGAGEAPGDAPAVPVLVQGAPDPSAGPAEGELDPGTSHPLAA